MQALDQALVTTFIAPDSFTGENLVEISGHGGHYVPALVMETLISRGARPALPGEFTRRAVLNGKLDITQAEAIGDLVDARSGAMHRTALAQLDGGLSRRIAALRDELISVESLIAYDIDFPEEDDGPISRDRVMNEVSELEKSLDALLATVPLGEVIREGAVVVIAGLPNVGKSSLFNALLGRSRAIVTDIPGTTRDAIEGFLETTQWPLRLVDTAGLREADDVVERIGIEVSEKYLGWANVVLACGDSDSSLSQVLATLDGKTSAPVIRVRTKADLLSVVPPERFDVKVSAETGEGLSDLIDLIDKALAASVGSVVVDTPILTRSRHIHGITQARSEIEGFAKAWREEELPAPVAAVHLRSATVALESLIGAVSTEDVLDRVFSSFCVGK
jgi:tRNA modification GTPase